MTTPEPPPSMLALKTATTAGRTLLMAAIRFCSAERTRATSALEAVASQPAAAIAIRTTIGRRGKRGSFIMAYPWPAFVGVPALAGSSASSEEPAKAGTPTKTVVLLHHLGVGEVEL